MHLIHERLRKSPVTFQKMTGLAIEKFDQLVILLSPSFAQIEAKKLRSGRNSRLSSVSDKLLCGLVYYRTYITHTFLGYLFSLHNSNICRLLQKLEPLLVKKITITKDRSLTADKVLKLLVDVSEQPTQRPVKKTKELLFREEKAPYDQNRNGDGRKWKN